MTNAKYEATTAMVRWHTTPVFESHTNHIQINSKWCATIVLCALINGNGKEINKSDETHTHTNNINEEEKDRNWNRSAIQHVINHFVGDIFGPYLYCTLCVVPVLHTHWITILVFDFCVVKLSTHNLQNENSSDKKKKKNRRRWLLLLWAACIKW